MLCRGGQDKIDSIACTGVHFIFHVCVHVHVHVHVRCEWEGVRERKAEAIILSVFFEFLACTLDQLSVYLDLHNSS